MIGTVAALLAGALIAAPIAYALGRSRGYDEGKLFELRLFLAEMRSLDGAPLDESVWREDA